MEFLTHIPLKIGVLCTAYFLDVLLGDPRWKCHPIRIFGFLIFSGERFFNRGKARFFKGMSLCVFLVLGVYFFFNGLDFLPIPLFFLFALKVIFTFFGLAGKSLISEGKAVLNALSQSTQKGRKRLAWIVGRDTQNLSPQQIMTAVFETLSENLSDGLIAPMFYYFLLGLPGIMAYKMVNTLDSMIGYKNEKFEWFGKFAARLDDVLNFIPARITAVLMLFVTGKIRLLPLVFKLAKNHSSPNAGYPEAALALILNCRFGGGNFYKGKWVEKPYIGIHKRKLSSDEFERVSIINQRVGILFLVGIAFSLILLKFFT